MKETKKITVEIPEALLLRAQKSSGTGITQTIRQGLQLVAAGDAYRKLATLRGKVKFSRSWLDLKDDR